MYLKTSCGGICPLNSPSRPHDLSISRILTTNLDRFLIVWPSDTKLSIRQCVHSDLYNQQDLFSSSFSRNRQWWKTNTQEVTGGKWQFYYTAFSKHRADSTCMRWKNTLKTLFKSISCKMKKTNKQTKKTLNQVKNRKSNIEETLCWSNILKKLSFCAGYNVGVNYKH